MLGFVFGEHFKEKAAGGLDLASGFAGAGIALKYQAGDAGDFAELASGQFGGIQAGE